MPKFAGTKEVAVRLREMQRLVFVFPFAFASAQLIGRSPARRLHAPTAGHPKDSRSWQRAAPRPLQPRVGRRRLRGEQFSPNFDDEVIARLRLLTRAPTCKRDRLV